MSSLTRLVQIGYVLGLALLLSLMLLPKSSQAQLTVQNIGGGANFGVSTGFRATPALPILVFPVLTASTSGFGGSVGGNGGLLGAGAGGAASGGSVSGSIGTSLVSLDLGSFFPNHGQIIGLPPPTLMPPLSNFYYGAAFEASTGAPWALLLTGGGGGVGGGGIGAGGGVGGVGGVAGAGGIGAGGFGGQIGGVGAGGGGFAGKGLGGFNGKKPL
jgi:hypothetical protein